MMTIEQLDAQNIVLDRTIQKLDKEISMLKEWKNQNEKEVLRILDDMEKHNPIATKIEDCTLCLGECDTFIE